MVCQRVNPALDITLPSIQSRLPSSECLTSKIAPRAGATRYRRALQESSNVPSLVIDHGLVVDHKNLRGARVPHHVIQRQRAKSGKQNIEREKAIRDAKGDYLNGTEPSIRLAAPTYGIPYTTLQNRLRGRQLQKEARRRQ